MTRGWQSTTLGEAGRWVSGGTPNTSTDAYWGGEIPWMSSKSLTEFRIRDSERRLTSLGTESGTRLVPKNTILMVVRGMSLKSEFRMGIAQREVALSQDLKGLIPRADVDPDFLAYALRDRSEAVLAMVDEAGHGTGRLQTDRLFGLELPLPPLLEQRAIAATLGAIDDKIESNHRASQLLYQIAIVSLSSGVEQVRVGDIATVNKGLSYKGSALDDGTSVGARPMLNLASFTRTGELKASGTKWYTGEFKPQHNLHAWELVLANTDLTQAREILGRGFLVPPKYEGALHTHHTSVVRFRERSELGLVLWAQTQSERFRERAKGFATGTTVVALPPEAVLDFRVSVPADLDDVLGRARATIEKAWQLEVENAHLSNARDALITELLSGRVRVPFDETS